jgi:hypothetical protein
VWFGEDGKRKLTQWMVEHAKIAWMTDKRPREIEAKIFATYGYALPLNISHGNRKNNPFADRLSELRRLRD